MFTLENVHKTYGKGNAAYEALRGVSLEIAQGESLAVVGKSGSGKSTLMHLLAGLDTPSQGEIKLAGQSLRRMKEGALSDMRNQKFGFIFQQFFLQPSLTVLENVVLPLKIRGISRADREKAAMDVLREVGLEDKAKNRATDLSGGQKQRVAIARALVTQPDVIFADEPTGNLDSETGDEVVKLLFGLHKERGITLIVVTHDQDLAKRCDRRVFIQDGKIKD